ncbi:hypothetical protein [Actinoplanes regularis]|uniref:hypothetical protein n=1 Tax=Actinoplanes regularis TaxID=52697 RepID=UPI002552FEDA|nr:hypothetical protein [Actinoplanes regularis]
MSFELRHNLPDAVIAEAETANAKIRTAVRLLSAVTKTPARRGATAAAEVAARKRTLMTRPCNRSGVIDAW